MRTARRVIHTLLAALLLGAVMTAAPAAQAAQVQPAKQQMEILDKNTVLREDRTVTSDYKVTKGTLKLERMTMTVAGDFYLEGGTVKIDRGTLNIQGDLYVASDLQLTYGKVNVGGQVIHTDGKINLGGGALNVAGDYHIATPKTNEAGELIWTSSTGELLMRQSNDTVTVGGDFYTDARYGVDCTAGTLTVAGDFTQHEDYDPKKFHADNYHKVVLNGTEPQTVTLENARSTFARLEVANPEGIIVTDHFAVSELLSQTGEVKIQSDGAIFEDVAVKVPLVTVTGDLTQNGDLDLEYYTMKIDGSLTQTDGEINVEWGTLDIAGDYYLAKPEVNEAGETVWSGSPGVLTMQYPRSTVNVGGDFAMNATDAVRCTAGTLTVGGDFTQWVNYTSKRFHAENIHKVVLSGTEPQTITLQNADSTFAKLEIHNPAGIIVTDYFAAAELTAPSGKVSIQSDGAAFENVTLNVPQVTVTGDLIQDGVLNLKNHAMKVDGSLIQTNGEINVESGTLDITGDYYIAIPELNDDGELSWFSSYGKLTMQNPKGSVNVGGSFYVDTANDTSANLTVLGNIIETQGPAPVTQVDTQPDADKPDQVVPMPLYFALPKPTVVEKALNILQARESVRATGGTYVWMSETGIAYHTIPNCGNQDSVNAIPVLLTAKLQQQYGACPNCFAQ